jgi:hypothetical protein
MPLDVMLDFRLSQTMPSFTNNAIFHKQCHLSQTMPSLTRREDERRDGG